MTTDLRAIYIANIKGAGFPRRLCLAKIRVLVSARKGIAIFKFAPELDRAAVKDLPDGKLVEISGACHVSHVEKPDEFEAALSDFLAARSH